MQVQQYSAPSHQPFYYNPLDVYRTAPDQYFATDELHDSRFSRGSSLSFPHQDYRYFSDRGHPPRQLQSHSSLAGTGLGATGMAITGGTANSSRDFRTEGIAGCHEQHQWYWPSPSASFHGVAQMPPTPCPPAVQVSTVKRPMEYTPVVLSPAAQLPTPASMAVLLNPYVRSEQQPSQEPFPQPQQPQRAPLPVPVRHVPLVADIAVPQSSSDNHSREKKHGCTMCHKRFDRPSTLRKHLLVHTGEKAFVCETCGRRFGVASNLNRHVKRCILKPVNTTPALANQAAGTSPGSTTSDSSSPSTTHSSVERLTENRRNRDSYLSSTNASSSSSSDQIQTLQTQSLSTNTPQARSPMQKRRRRAPSPSRWVPPSLLTFNLNPPESKKATPVPLAPVKRNMPKEERDSWDENVSSTPYHPTGWKGILPGPGLGLGLGLGGKDVRNINLGGSGGFMLGRVLVF
ncbi:hypothetical protein BDZ94DRAFT_1250088 [Collybia nuda]|uniref:C2H2-type domain-containing protein n=1 Tax=Collybia nuda TaxID=64659 RepID=A0A9P5YDL1_9AGAR|nr:hypothetical protein BDZ94DRAFT_1250088 [Collybia nuda]